MCWCKLAAQKWSNTDWCNFLVFNSPGLFFCLYWVNFSLLLTKVGHETVSQSRLPRTFCTGQCNRPVRHATYLCFCHFCNANVEKGLEDADCRRMTGIRLDEWKWPETFGVSDGCQLHRAGKVVCCESLEPVLSIVMGRRGLNGKGKEAFGSIQSGSRQERGLVV